MSEHIEGAPILVAQNDKKLKLKVLFTPFAAITIYSVVIPLLILDIWLSIYQLIYFSATGIPKIHKKDYIIFDRWQLNKLNFWQKINCVYCEYANGLIAWAKAIINQTEVYSCAIKHHGRLNGQGHQANYYEYEKFK